MYDKSVMRAFRESSIFRFAIRGRRRARKFKRGVGRYYGEGTT